MSIVASPFFSIIIPLYNKEREVVRAVFSCLDQTYGNFEIIVVDDGSTDKGPELVRQISDRRIRMVAKQNGGQAAARNCGARLATADFLCFLDADDYWLPGHLERLWGNIAKIEECSAFVNAFAYEKNGKLRYCHFPQIRDNKGFISDYLKQTHRKTSPITTNSIAIRRSLFNDLNGFDETLPLAQDIDLWIRLDDVEKIYYDPKVTSVYCLGATNRVTAANDRANKYAPFLSKINKKIKATPSSGKKDRLERMARRMTISLCAELIRAGSDVAGLMRLSETEAGCLRWYTGLSRNSLRRRIASFVADKYLLCTRVRLASYRLADNAAFHISSLLTRRG